MKIDVLCINNTFGGCYLTENKVYKDVEYDVKNEMIWLTNDKGVYTNYGIERFKLIKESIREEKEDELNEVDHPTHYNKGIETWDYTDSWNMDFLEGNIIKYVTRYKHKNGIKDLEKAKQYLERLIERENKKND